MHIRAPILPDGVSGHEHWQTYVDNDGAAGFVVTVDADQSDGQRWQSRFLVEAGQEGSAATGPGRVRAGIAVYRAADCELIFEDTLEFGRLLISNQEDETVLSSPEVSLSTRQGGELPETDARC